MMAARMYIAEFFFDPVQNCSFPATRDYAPEYTVIAERNRVNKNAGSRCLVIADMTLAQHTAAVADARIVHIPLERIAGQLADAADTIADLTGAQKLAIRNRLQAIGIDLSDVDDTWTVLRVLRAMVQRIHALQAVEPIS